MKKPYTFTLEQWQIDRLREIAKEDDRPVSATLRRILKREFDRREAKAKQEATNGA